MDVDIGTVAYSDDDESYTPYKHYSEKTAEAIDDKVKTYMSDCYAQSIDIITHHKKFMQDMSQVLLEKEYITKDEFERMMTDPIQIDAILVSYEAEQKKLLADAKKIIKSA